MMMMMMMMVVVVMVIMKMCAEAETGDNNDELERQTGRPVSYADVIQVNTHRSLAPGRVYLINNG